jgi:hypothetical protein
LDLSFYHFLAINFVSGNIGTAGNYSFRSKTEITTAKTNPDIKTSVFLTKEE